MADKKLLSKEIALVGKLVTSVDPATIDTNFRELKNFRYTDTGLRALQGMTKINTTAITTYINLKHGFHFNKAQPTESHVLVQAYNSGETASRVLDNKTAIPSQGDFEATALHTDASGASHGHFSAAPGGSVAYCNSAESMVWGGDEHFCSGFINYDEAGGTFEYNFIDVINNTKTDANNIATLKASGAETAFYLGSIRPLKGIKLTVGVVNTVTATIAGEYWSGSAWVSLGGLTDNTASGGVTLAQTGTITFNDTEAVAKVKAINAVVIYWYKFQTNTPIDEATITQATVDASFQSVKDIWDGEPRTLLKFLKSSSSGAKYADDTLRVREEDFSDAGGSPDESTFSILSALATTEHIAIGFTERLMGLSILFTPDGENTGSNTTLTLSYWNGTAWAALTISDGTSVSSKSFAQSAWITWDAPAKNLEFKQSINNSAELYYYQLKFDQTLGAKVWMDYVSGISAPVDIGNYKFPLFAHNRLFLCSDQDGKKNSVLPSATDSSAIFNGDDSLELSFGDDREITAGVGLFRQYGSDLYNLTVFTKSNETWVLAGNNPEDWTQYQASGSIGCPAQHTMVVANVGFEAVPTQNRYVAIWQGLEGIYLFDGSVIRKISQDIDNYFDKRSSDVITSSKIGDSVAFLDHQNQEYHWIFANAASTTFNKELVYDLDSQKWYEPSRGSGKILQMGVEVADTDGNRYNYGGANAGFLYRLDNGTDFDGNNITASFRFGDMALGGEEGGSITTLTRLRKIKLITSAKTSTSNNISITHQGDGNTTGTTLTAMSPIKSGYRIAQVVTGTNQGRFTFHDLDFSITTSNESIPFEPLFVGLIYTEEGLDLN